MPEPVPSLPVLAQPPLCSRAGAQTTSPRTQISQIDPQPTAPNGNPNRSPEPLILDSNTASIPSSMCLILKARNLPNPGKDAFHILNQASSQAPRPNLGICAPLTRLTFPSLRWFLYLRHLSTSLPEAA